LKTETLDELRRIMRGERRAGRAAEGVTVTPVVTSKTSIVRRVTAVTPDIDEKGNENKESASADAGGPDPVAIEERAGLAADRVPRVYLDAWSRLNCQKPERVSEYQWRHALNDGGRFLDEWGREAAELGWRPGELFDPGDGLVWQLADEHVRAIGADRAWLSDRSIALRLQARGFR
jgi:hypothetical protein